MTIWHTGDILIKTGNVETGNHAEGVGEDSEPRQSLFLFMKTANLWKTWLRQFRSSMSYTHGYKYSTCKSNI